MKHAIDAARERGEHAFTNRAMFISFKDASGTVFVAGETFDLSKEADREKFVEKLCARAEHVGDMTRRDAVLSALGVTHFGGTLSLK